MNDLPKGKPILCVDFDGVIHSYASGFKGVTEIPDSAVGGAIQFLYKAICCFDVQIYSTRSSYPGGIKAMQEWLSMQEKIWRDRSSQLGHPLPRTSLLLNIKWPTQKPKAFLMIDDRAFCFEGHWPKPEELLKFKPWNKK